MTYLVCRTCSHTTEPSIEPAPTSVSVFQRCFSCGKRRWFRIVHQVEQPDGSVVEVTR